MNEELYFKDAFTEVDGSINLEVNNLKANCIASNNNKFSLDSEGNLIVNSITTKQTSGSNIDFDMIYPVGSIYFSVNEVNPGTLFSGVWERFANGRVLVGVDETQTEFNVVQKTGGHKDLQSHSHTFSGTTSIDGNHKHNSIWGYRSIFQVGSNNRPDVRESGNSTATSEAGNHSHTFSGTTTNAGTGNSGNLQPFITCYIWKRTA